MTLVRNFNGLLILFLSITLGACSGGGSDPVSEKNPDHDVNTKPTREIIDITNTLPYTGTVGSAQVQPYKVNGLLSDTVYTITLQRMSGSAILLVQDAVREAIIECGFVDQSAQASFECAMRSNSSGQLLFSVRAPNDGGQVQYQLAVQQGGVVNEGTPQNPIDLDILPATGGTLTESYYRIGGLMPKANYTFQFSNASGNVQFSVNNEEGFSGALTCTLFNPVRMGNSCVVKSTSAGELFVEVFKHGEANMANYSLLVQEYAGTGFISEGTTGAPVNITDGLPYYGEVGSGAKSYYELTGMLPDAIYTISLRRIIGAAVLQVDNATGNSSVDCGWSNASPDLLLECAMLSHADGTLPFSVDRVTGEAGGLYELNVSQGGIINEGSQSQPRELSIFPVSGSALTQSYYRAGGLLPNSVYTFSVTDVSGDVAFFIYDTPLFQQEPSVCFLFVGVTPNNECVVTSTADGEIFVMSNVQNEDYNVQYTMWLTAGP